MPKADESTQEHVEKNNLKRLFFADFFYFTTSKFGVSSKECLHWYSDISAIIMVSELRVNAHQIFDITKFCNRFLI